jgi:hypothetical protein
MEVAMKFLCVFFVLVFLVACGDGYTPNVCPPAFEPINAQHSKTTDLCAVSLATFIRNQSGSETSRLSRDALFVNDAYREYVNTQKPLTVFLFTNDGLNQHLSAQGISREAFLAHPRLGEFIAATMVSEISIVETVSAGQTITLQMQAGNNFTVSNRHTVNIQTRFDINGQKAVCIQRRSLVFPEETNSSSVCLTSRPFVAFTW